MTWVYEDPKACATRLGTTPHSTRVGMAQSDDGPGAVIWQETGVAEIWDPPVFVPANWVRFVVGEAMSAALCDQDWLLKYLTGATAYDPVAVPV